ncbi:cell division protein FtsB [Cupriavidus metallidurans]|uniref:hypothetical protein n=1 Tax=Cupriavidus metallidurans TaxID=119219 RepID=UPI0004933D1F|nr:hypothetical protein [Cupriavidus metallidurans]MDE4917751.1 hypothetical protein [Cupriavidus metallidurans]
MYRTYSNSELERAAYIDPANVAAVKAMAARFFEVSDENDQLQERVEELEQEVENLQSELLDEQDD